MTLLVTRLSELSQRARLVLGVAAAVSVLGFLLLGLAATSNPLPPGDLTTSGCLAT